MAGVAGLLDGPAQGLQVGDTIAHHAAIQKHATRVGKPVAKVVAGDPNRAGALEFRGRGEIPPDMMDTDGDDDRRMADRLTQMKRVTHGDEAGAVSAIDRQIPRPQAVCACVRPPIRDRRACRWRRRA